MLVADVSVLGISVWICNAARQDIRLSGIVLSQFKNRAAPGLGAHLGKKVEVNGLKVS